MATVTPRLQKMSDLVRKELAKIILQELNDHRIGRVTIGDVRLAADLSFAKIYVSSLDKPTLETSIKGLNHAKKHIRSLLAHRLQLRKTPSLLFVPDESILKGDHLLHLINDSLNHLNHSNHVS